MAVQQELPQQSRTKVEVAKIRLIAVVLEERM
jgi:hypothetical protein